jgi:hypothetical protein
MDIQLGQRIKVQIHLLHTPEITFTEICHHGHRDNYEEPDSWP